MKTSWLRPTVLAILGLVTTCAWAVLIWVACYVSTIILDTLQMIVDLAAMS